MTTKAVPVVGTGPEFREHVRDGDIILFDKLAPLNRLVQWGDNRPVGHCAVWWGGGVYEATIKDGAGGVFHTPFEDLLRLPVKDTRAEGVGLVRTFTAMRLDGIGRDDFARVRAFLETRRRAKFAVKEMVLLTPFAIERAHGGADESRSEVMAAVTGAVVAVMKLQARLLLAGRGGADRMFCSELVFRAFAEAGLVIDIVDPLFARYPVARPGGGRRRDDGRGTFGPDGEIVIPEDLTVDEVLLDYQEVFEQLVLEEPGPEDLDDGGGGVRRGDDEDDRRGFPFRSRRPLELADMVTPGDFWTSPSLRPAAVLHRVPER